jgi:hypothetical protein
MREEGEGFERGGCFVIGEVVIPGNGFEELLVHS